MKSKFLYSTCPLIILIVIFFYPAQAQKVHYLAQWNGSSVNGSASSPLKNPFGIVIDNKGNVFVADLGNKLIKKFSISGELIAQWGAGGITNVSGVQAFNGMGDITVDATGNLYVADFPYRVLRYSNSGVYDPTFAPAILNGVRSVAISPLNGNVYVTDANHFRVSIYNSSGGFPINTIGTGIQGNAPNQFGYPTDLTFDKSGNLYVVDQSNNRVMQYAPSTTTNPTIYGTTQLNGPWCVAVDNSGLVYVTNSGNSIIDVYNKGVFQYSFGANGSETPLNYPVGITIDNYNSGTVFVNDFNNNRVVAFNYCAGIYMSYDTWWFDQRKYSSCMTIDRGGSVLIAESTSNPNGPYTINVYNSATLKSAQDPMQPLRTIGAANFFASAPNGITTDPDYSVYVLYNQTIYKFLYFSGYQNYVSYTFPVADAYTGIHYGKDGFLYVADFNNNRLVKFNSSLVFQGYIGVGATYPGTSFVYPNGITTDNAGNIYVSTWYNGIWKFDKNGTVIKAFSAPINGTAFSQPTGLAIDNSGNLLVADASNKRIVKCDNNGLFLTSLTCETCGNNQYYQSVAFDNNCNIYTGSGMGLIMFSYNTPYFRIGNIESSQSEISQAISVSPNPSFGNVNIIFAKSGKHDFTIYDSQGQLIKSESIVGDNYLLNDESIKAGLYIIQDNFNGAVDKAKIIIQK